RALLGFVYYAHRAAADLAQQAVIANGLLRCAADFAAKAQRIMHAARAGGFERHQRGEQFQNLPRILRMLRRKIGEYGTLALAMQIEKPGGQLLQRIALAASDTWRPRGNEG